MFRHSLVYTAVLGLFVLNVSECFVLQPSALVLSATFTSQKSSCGSMCRATPKSLTYKLGTVQLKETKEYFGSRGSKTSSKINVFSSLISSVASTTDKWTVLEQFQTTAEMDFFIVGAPSTVHLQRKHDFVR